MQSELQFLVWPLEAASKLDLCVNKCSFTAEMNLNHEFHVRGEQSAFQCVTGEQETLFRCFCPLPVYVIRQEVAAGRLEGAKIICLHLAKQS